MSNKLENVGLLLVGHGTRDQSGTRQYLELAEGLKERFKPLAVEGAFLELAQPGIDIAVRRLIECGIGQIVTVPVILLAAGHVKRDIPAEVAAALAEHGRTDIKQTQVGHLGCHPALIELSQVRMEEALGLCVSPGNPGNEEAVGTARPTCLLLVARGSSDDQAAEEMREIAALREAERRGMDVKVAFLAKARPSLDEQLVKLAGADYERVIVQPHFLFEGELVQRIRGQIGGIASTHTKTEWILTRPLADSLGTIGLASKLLQKVILDRCQEVGIRVVVSAGDD
jgi:sirohydrochlorin ferrochelatase